MQIFNQLNKLDLILGSQSPRRKLLLESAGFSFRTWAIPTDELFPTNLQPSEIALYLCRQKAESYKNLLRDDSILITADTIVAKDQHILNKAATQDEAFGMLTLLNGTSHEVITGVSITSSQHQKTFFETTRVYFDQLSSEEINWYISNFKPFDKAGAYGIQEWIGMIGVKKIEGCYYNVVGLPLPALYREMKFFLSEHF
jgi:septum formation protein